MLLSEEISARRFLPRRSDAGTAMHSRALVLFSALAFLLANGYPWNEQFCLSTLDPKAPVFMFRCFYVFMF